MALAWIVRKSIVTDGVITTERGTVLDDYDLDVPAGQQDRVVVYDDGGSVPALGQYTYK